MAAALILVLSLLGVPAPAAGAQDRRPSEGVRELWEAFPLDQGRPAAPPVAQPQRAPQPAPEPEPSLDAPPVPLLALAGVLSAGLLVALVALVRRRGGSSPDPVAGAMSRTRPERGAARGLGGTAAGLLGLAAVATGAARAFEAGAPGLLVSLGAGFAAVGMLALVLVRYDAAVAVGFLLMGVVEVEPAPPDGAFALIIAVAIVTGRFRPSQAPRPVLVLVALLVALNAVSMLASDDLVVGLRFSAITVYLAIFAIWLAGWLRSVARARIVVWSWLAVAILSSVVGIAVVYLPIPGREILMDGTLTRANVLFEDANVYGPFLVPIAAILLEERLRPRLLPLASSLSAVLFLILVVGVVVSFSRAGWINFVVATLVMLGVVALRRRGGRGALRMLATLGVVATAATSVMAATGSLSFFGERAKVQSYDAERFGAQRAGIVLATTHPVGVGPGQFKFHHPVETHSTYIRVLAEQGLLGLAVWLALVATTLTLAVRNAIAGRDTFGIGSAALLGSWCGLVVNSVVVDTLHWRHLWVVAALIWAGALRDRRPVAISARGTVGFGPDDPASAPRTPGQRVPAGVA